MMRRSRDKESVAQHSGKRKRSYFSLATEASLEKLE